ncbi:MAG: hypothetical protein ACRCTI_14505, partial [Beijerinckiaceae bacterium]
MRTIFLLGLQKFVFRQSYFVFLACVAFAFSAAAQPSPPPAYVTDGLKMGFDIRENRILEGIPLSSNINVGTVDACAK